MIPIFTKQRWGTSSSTPNSARSVSSVQMQETSLHSRLLVPRSSGQSVSQPSSPAASPVLTGDFGLLDFPVVLITPLTEESLAAHTKLTNPADESACKRCRHCKRAMKSGHVNKQHHLRLPRDEPDVQSHSLATRSTSTGTRSRSSNSKSRKSTSNSRRSPRAHSAAKSQDRKGLDSASKASEQGPRWMVLLDFILAQSLI